MTKLAINRNLLLLHLTVLVWGFTGILGALISISAIHLVWYRVLIAACSLFIYFKFTRKSIKVSKTQFVQLLFTGGLVGLHWILFFQSIKVANVSVTLICLSSLTLFTALLEPLFNRQKIELLELAVGILIIFGIYLIFTFETQYVMGIILGLLCALCGSLFTIINGKLVKHTKATTISLYEMFGAWVWVSIFMFIFGGFGHDMQLNSSDLFYLLLLGTVCTSAAYVAGVSVMKELSAFRVALVTNLEPVYGILLALLFFKREEQMSIGFYGGAIIVLGAVFLYPIAKTKFEHKKVKKQLPTI
ncbi:DMT family transporter [Olivibacter sp. SDN3]|uniref:DMT family transporter n=1 Tax=Olivibacter sp. SDN3 TaxID=2764720 RepID=UPI00165142CA|nr:DMT family transporter [Olivibacter sp. SDN3]QNL47783.1 DMT family transporter [Olivibacter sp. SDN3]